MDNAAASNVPAWVWWAIVVGGALVALVIFLVVRKGKRLTGEHVFQASRWSRGNRLLPAQVRITEDSITLYQPQWIGKLEESIHMSHVSSIKIDTDLIFSDVFIETTGGHNPIVCHGHTKGDAIKMKQVIEGYQSQYFRKS
jgi:hypothetical protein